MPNVSVSEAIPVNRVDVKMYSLNAGRGRKELVQLRCGQAS